MSDMRNAHKNFGIFHMHDNLAQGGKGGGVESTKWWIK